MAGHRLSPRLVGDSPRQDLDGGRNQERAAGPRDPLTPPGGAPPKQTKQTALFPRTLTLRLPELETVLPRTLARSEASLINSDYTPSSPKLLE